MATKVAVIGAGSWGTAVAAIAASRTPTILWARREELATQINAEHRNGDYLADYPLPSALAATHDMEEAVHDADVVIMGVPSHGFRDILAEASAHIAGDTPIVSLTKGVEQETLKRMTEVIDELAPGRPPAC